jgi:hypothetical protein
MSLVAENASSCDEPYAGCPQERETDSSAPPEDSACLQYFLT